jgi:hypothetical protein
MKDALSFLELVDLSVIASLQKISESCYETVFDNPGTKHRYTVIGKRFSVPDAEYLKIGLSLGIPKHPSQKDISLYTSWILHFEMFDGEETQQNFVYMLALTFYKASQQTEEDRKVQKRAT